MSFTRKHTNVVFSACNVFKIKCQTFFLFLPFSQFHSLWWIFIFRNPQLGGIAVIVWTTVWTTVTSHGHFYLKRLRIYSLHVTRDVTRPQLWSLLHVKMPVLWYNDDLTQIMNEVVKQPRSVVSPPTKGKILKSTCFDVCVIKRCLKKTPH